VKIGDTKPGEKFITSTEQRITKEGAKNSRRIKPGDFVLSKSMSYGRPYISKIDGCIHDGWLAISDYEGSLNSDYLYHVLQSHKIQMEFAKRASSGTVSNLNADIVKLVELPVPSLIEQGRIADILNDLEKLINDHVVGLPAEIAARQKQFAYYRNSLVLLPESASA
jgi:type I restriction enzyme S subunit